MTPNQKNQSGWTIREMLICAAVLLLATSPIWSQMAVRVDNNSKAIIEPASTNFWAANPPTVGAITNAIGGTNAPTVRSALGLGTAATNAATSFATSAQGALADTALQASFATTNQAQVLTSTNTVMSPGRVRNAINTANSSFGVPSSIDNMTPFSFAKIDAWTTGGGGSVPPLRVLVFGDSYSTGIQPGPKMAVQGVISGNAPINITGTVTTRQLPSTGDYTAWVNGRVHEFAVGSTGTFTQSSSTTGDVIGNEIAIYYIREPGGGSFDFQWSSNGGSSWTTAGTISASNATTIGAASTFSVSSSNFPRYRVRVTNVTGATVRIIGWGIYNTNGGGIIWINGLCNEGGVDLTGSVQTPTAILDPIWTSVAPDLVLVCMADGAAEWQTGGNWLTMYSRFKAARNATDFVIISGNPDQGDTGYRLDQQLAQHAWARDVGESYIDGHSLFRNYTWANSKGLMGDTTHLNSAGLRQRNRHIWQTLAIGHEPLGRSPVYGHNNIAQFSGMDTFPALYDRGNGPFTSKQMWMSNPIVAPGSLAVAPSSYTAASGSLAVMSNDGVNAVFGMGASNFGVSGEVSLLGWHPASNNLMLGGRGNFRWRAGLTGIQLGYRAVSADATFGTDDHVIEVTANSPTITLPAATATNSSTGFTHNVAAGIAGKVFIIRNTGAGTVTVATTSSQTIDGSAPGTVAAGASLKVMSTGSNWITIP